MAEADVSFSDQTLFITGQLDFSNVTALQERLSSDAPITSVDLSGVSQMDSAGVALLVWLAARYQERGAKLVFSGLNGQSADLLRVADLSFIVG